MITRMELKNKWKQLIDEHLDEEEEAASVLYENDWVRIFAIKKTEMLEEFRANSHQSFGIPSTSGRCRSYLGCHDKRRSLYCLS